MPGTPDDAGPGGIRLVSAVIVNYRSAGHLLACVASLEAEGVDDIVVVDNASGDDSRARLAGAHPRARYVAMDRNRGYGAAANRGVAVTTTPVVLICNPDLVVEAGAGVALARALDTDPSVGAAGPRIDRPDGTRYPSARAFPSVVDAAGHGFIGLVTARNPFSERYLRTDEDRSGSVDWVSGACMAVRRAAFDDVGGFDEVFFMFMEDVDLCWRMSQHGWAVRYVAEARVVHREGVSRASAPYRMIAAHHQSLLRYALRTTTGRQRWWLPVVAVGLVVRMVLLWTREATRSVRRRTRWGRRFV